MLIKDKDILADNYNVLQSDGKTKPQRPRIDKNNMRSAWGDAFDYYLRGITSRYLKFFGRASRLEFWGYSLVSSLVFFILYLLGEYVEIPMLAYYFTLATLFPTVAVAARRLHDVNKNAFVYLGMIIPILASAFFIGWFALILLLLWGIVLVRLFSKETDLHSGLYGEPNENDEIYGKDNLPIIRKFRFLSIVLFALWSALTFVNFDDWSTQAEYRDVKNTIMERVGEEGKKAGLNEEQIQFAQDLMKQTLRSWQGKSVQEKDITQAIEQAVRAISQSSNNIEQKK